MNPRKVMIVDRSGRGHAFAICSPAPTRPLRCCMCLDAVRSNIHEFNPRRHPAQRLRCVVGACESGIRRHGVRRQHRRTGRPLSTDCVPTALSPLGRIRRRAASKRRRWTQGALRALRHSSRRACQLRYARCGQADVASVDHDVVVKADGLCAAMARMSAPLRPTPRRRSTPSW